ncbi:isoprenoid synthase domain-containing protein [Coniochaeta sp. 2T2.1]|nr:isoprenoid synthase domain-containing protein [Coniochaeta sp. 2T2.1]
MSWLHSVSSAASVRRSSLIWSGDRASRRPWVTGNQVPMCAAVKSARHMSTAVHQSRESILETLNGQMLRLPDLSTLFKDWPRVVNPHGRQVTNVVQDVLSRHTVAGSALVKLTKGNLDVLLSNWFPFASPERLAQLASFVCWMYIFDDELDAMTAAGRDSEADFVHTWNETLRIVAESCGLQGKEADQQQRPRESDVKSADTFRPFGEMLTKGYTIEQRQRFWDELDWTARSYRKEQLIRQGNQVPQYDAYCDYRHGSSCMGQVLAMIEFSNESHLPPEIMESLEMKALWFETISVLWVTNDIISVKKEVAGAFLENLVVIAAKPAYQLQTGLDHCHDKLRGVIANLDNAAARLRAKYVTGNNGETAREVDKFIVNCQSMCVGTFEWSLASPRFGLVEYPRDSTGTIIFAIGA